MSNKDNKNKGLLPITAAMLVFVGSLVILLLIPSMVKPEFPNEQEILAFETMKDFVLLLAIFIPFIAARFTYKRFSKNKN